MDLPTATQLITAALSAKGVMTGREIAAEAGIDPRRTSNVLNTLVARNLVFVADHKIAQYGKKINIYALATDAPALRQRRDRLSTHRVRPPLPTDCNVLGIWTQLLKPHERQIFKHPPAQMPYNAPVLQSAGTGWEARYQKAQ